MQRRRVLNRKTKLHLMKSTKYNERELYVHINFLVLSVRSKQNRHKGEIIIIFFLPIIDDAGDNINLGRRL